MTTGGVDPAPGFRHETAIIHPEAEIAESATVGPYALIGPRVTIGERVRIASHVFIEKDTRVAADCVLGNGAVLGTDPQDIKYSGEPTTLEVGERTVVREYATLHRGSIETRTTIVGTDCLIMAYAHVSHDSRIGSHVVLANAVNMGGHVSIEDHATVGGVTAIHQFVRIGRFGFIGGGSRVPQDVPPYVMVAGNPCKAYGLNVVGLRRHGFSPETVKALRRAYREIFRSEKPVRHALDQLEAHGGHPDEVLQLITFIRESRRGVTT
jgi:UDP-N-acetylglucosamine acyltransferase